MVSVLCRRAIQRVKAVTQVQSHPAEAGTGRPGQAGQQRERDEMQRGDQVEHGGRGRI